MSSSKLAYMATALAASMYGLDVPSYPSSKPAPRSCDQKKCKSCRYIEKDGKYACKCTCGKYPKQYVYPLKCACEYYEKRKRRK